jgi:hypothetical protein
LDDLPIHIRPDLPGNAGANLTTPMGSSHYGASMIASSANADMAAINLKRAEFHGEWNYTISPTDHPPNRALIL